MSLNSILAQIKEAETAKRNALASLHAELGYGSAQALAEAILEASGGSKVKVSNGSNTKSSSPKAAKKGRSIAPEIKQQVLVALKAGRAGATVAKEFGVSYPTVHKWKSEAGMVRARSVGRGGKRK